MNIDWENDVDTTFWGKIPDRVIAAIEGVHITTIGRKRRQFGIPSYLRWRFPNSVTQPYADSWTPAFRRSIRKRDNYHCRLCGDASRRLDVHHIDYDKTNSARDNCITLCLSCHMRTNTNRIHWARALQMILDDPDKAQTEFDLSGVGTTRANHAYFEVDDILCREELYHTFGHYFAFI